MWSFLMEMVDQRWSLVKIRSKFFQLDVKSEAIQSILFQQLKIDNSQLLLLSPCPHFATNALYEWQCSTTDPIHTVLTQNRRRNEVDFWLTEKMKNCFVKLQGRSVEIRSLKLQTYQCYLDQKSTSKSHSWKCVISRSIFDSKSMSNLNQNQVHFFSPIENWRQNQNRNRR